MVRYLFLIFFSIAIASATPLENIIENHNSVMLLIDPESGEILKANSSASEFYGYSVDELEDMKIQDINTFTTEQIAQEMVLAEAQNRNYFLFRHRLSDGSTKRVQVYSSPVSYGQKHVLLSVIHDVSGIDEVSSVIDYYSSRLEEQVDIRTEELSFHKNLLIVLLVLQFLAIVFLLYNITRRKVAEKNLAELNRNLEQKVADAVAQIKQKDSIIYEQSKRKALDRLLVDLAHHWRQPLNVAALEIQSIDDFIDECSGENKKEIDSLISSALHEMKSLSNTITYFTSFYEKKSSEKITIKKGLKESIKLSLDAFKAKGLNLKQKINDSFTTKAEADEWVEIFSAFFINAKEIKESRGLGKIEVEIEAYGDSSEDVIVIKDNGGGIDEALLPDEIFKPYTTANFKSRDRGLGLYMVHNIITHRLGGEIRAINHPNGAMFVIKIKK